MSRSQLTILTNICLIEDLETQRVVMPFLEVMLKIGRASCRERV